MDDRPYTDLVLGGLGDDTSDHFWQGARLKCPPALSRRHAGLGRPAWGHQKAYLRLKVVELTLDSVGGRDGLRLLGAEGCNQGDLAKVGGHSGARQRVYRPSPRHQIHPASRLLPRHELWSTMSWSDQEVPVAKKTESKRIPSDREAVVLQILLGRDKYGLELCEEFEKRAKQSMPIGTIYGLMDRMAADGWVTSYMGEATHERGGNRRKYFHAEGKAASAALERYQESLKARLGILGLLGRVCGVTP